MIGGIKKPARTNSFARLSSSFCLLCGIFFNKYKLIDISVNNSSLKLRTVQALCSQLFIDFETPKYGWAGLKANKA